MKIPYKIGAIFFLIVILSTSNTIFAQKNRYSIENNVKNRRIPIKFFLKQTKESLILELKTRKKRRVSKRISRKIIRHTYSIQTHKTKQRMRKTRKEAEDYNQRRIPLKLKIKKILNG